jgi:hypothetical protein
MNQAAVKALVTLREDGHQMGLVGRMQTREELYAVLGYHVFEAKLDALFGAEAEGAAAGPAPRNAAKAASRAIVPKDTVSRGKSKTAAAKTTGSKTKHRKGK